MANGFSPVPATKAWIAEEKVFNLMANSCPPREKCGHYTQIVWAGTQEVSLFSACKFGGLCFFN